MASNQIPEPCEPVHLGDFFLEDRRFPAVYFLYYRGDVVYVGQTTTLQFRIDAHISQGVKVFDAVAFIRCSVDQLLKVEAHYIRVLAPKYNACGLSKKVRERASWTREDSRRRARKSVFDAEPPKDGEELKVVHASECMVDPRHIGEFLQVSDADVAEWRKDGSLPETNSILDLLYFVYDNAKVRKAIDRHEALLP